MDELRQYVDANWINCVSMLTEIGTFASVMSGDYRIYRTVLDQLINKIRPGKVMLILGPRRAGKSHLLDAYVAQTNDRYIFLNGEDDAVGRLIGTRTFTNYASLIGDNKLLIIDEAQKIQGIGPALKFLVDSFPDLKIIATGSSMFDLDQKLGEPLTGRQMVFNLFPFSQLELSQAENVIDTQANLESRLIYGSYPELVNLPTHQQKAEYLKEIVNSYLLKDVLALDSIRNSQKIYDLLRLLALQLGQQVSLQELGAKVGMSKNTVERYLDLMEKCFVIKRVHGFSRNLRNEITKMSKWYFLDNGIRNAIISNLNPLVLRGDVGALWENYLVMERLKYQSDTRMLVNNYFWRTHNQQELDWVEDRGGKLHGFEFKWSPNKTPRVPSAWTDGYPGALFSTINSANYLSWITGDGMSAEEVALLPKQKPVKKSAKKAKKKVSKKKPASSLKKAKVVTKKRYKLKAKRKK